MRNFLCAHAVHLIIILEESVGSRKFDDMRYHNDYRCNVKYHHRDQSELPLFNHYAPKIVLSFSC